MYAANPYSLNYDQGVWALNSGSDLYDTMTDLDLNLYIADVDGTALVLSSNGDAECNWYSWAALNDVIQSESGGYPSRYTGIFIGPGADMSDDHWPCTYKPWVDRARREAAEHPNIVKVVELDELHRLMDGPETVTWQDWELQGATMMPSAHWNKSNFEYLHGMVSSGTYLGPMVDNNGVSSPSCDAGAAILGGLGAPDLELWGRMVDVTLPRYILPSAVLGVPADPPYVAVVLHPNNKDDDPNNDIALPAPDPDYDFNNGDSVTVSWELHAPSSDYLNFHPNWRADLEFFYVVAEPVFGHVDLQVDVNASPITDGDVDFSTSHDYTTIQHSQTCIGGTSCTTASAWDSNTSATNDVELTLASSGTTLHNRDRMIYVWGVRVKYIDTSLDETFWQSDILDPDGAGYSMANFPSTTAAIAQDNGDWRITEDLDGLTIASMTYLDFDAAVWDTFMQDTCDYLHGFDVPKRCLLDERGSWNDYGAYYDPLEDEDGDGVDDDPKNIVDTSVIADRLVSGDSYGDGIISTWLPTPIEFVDTQGGRFGAKDPLDTTYDVMLYEPRQSRSIPGETHIYTGTVPNSCGFSNMTYIVEWDIGSDSTTSVHEDPLYHWYVKYNDVSDSIPWWNTLREGQTDVDSTDNIDIDGVDPGDQIRVSWVDIEGGGGPYEAIHALFRVDGPAGATGCDLEWEHSAEMREEVPLKNSADEYVPVTLSPTPTWVYDCITGYFTTGMTTRCL